MAASYIILPVLGGVRMPTSALYYIAKSVAPLSTPHASLNAEKQNAGWYRVHNLL